MKFFVDTANVDEIRRAAALGIISGVTTEIIAASIRTPMHVIEAARVGSHIATVPYKILEAMTRHPLTDAGIEKFLADWEKANRK